MTQFIKREGKLIPVSAILYFIQPTGSSTSIQVKLVDGTTETLKTYENATTAQTKYDALLEDLDGGTHVIIDIDDV